MNEVWQIVAEGPLSWLVLLLGLVAASAGYGVLACASRKHFWWSGICVAVGKVTALLAYGTIGTNFAMLLPSHPHLHGGHLTAATGAMSAALTVVSAAAIATDPTTRHAVVAWVKAFQAWTIRTLSNSFGNGKPPVHKM